jgi:hypothetical protein
MKNSMTIKNDKLFISTPKGVHILHDASARQFIPTRSFDYNAILGLDKPKNRVKALTAHTTPKNCRIGKIHVYVNGEEFWVTDSKVGLALLELHREQAYAQSIVYKLHPPDKGHIHSHYHISQ